MKIELNAETKFYTNGEDWLVKINIYTSNGGELDTLCFQLGSTHNHRFSESTLVKIPYSRFIDIVNTGIFKEIDVDSRIDWTTMEVFQEKI